MDLNDEYGIVNRIQKRTWQFGALYNFFRCPQVPLRAKYQVYMAIPLNTVLHGCEAWGIWAEGMRKLKVFHHHCLRRILRITMWDVQEKRITNAQVRHMFHHVPDIDSFIH